MTRQVEFVNRSGHTLRGIVNLPDTGVRFASIVNIHGFTGNRSGYKNIYTHTARVLAENGFASVRFDLYGNGESDGEFSDMTFTSILEDIEDIISWAKKQEWADPDKIIHFPGRAWRLCSCYRRPAHKSICFSSDVSWCRHVVRM